MQWLIHTVRTLFQRNAALGAVVVAAPLVAVGALIVILVAGSGGGVAEAAPDPLSPTYTDQVLDRIDTDAEALVDDVVTGLLPDLALTAEQSAAAVDGLAEALGVEAGRPELVAESLIRRLGADAVEAGSSEELVVLLVAAIDPDGTIESVDDLVDAVAAWAGRTSPHVLRLMDGDPDGVLSGLSGLTFEAASGALDGLGATVEVLDIGLGGVDGLGELVAPGVTWEVDDASRSIAFVAVTDDVGGSSSELFVVARWGDRTTPSLIGGLRLADWRLADAGFDGALGERVLPSTTFVLADRSETVAPSDVSAAMWARITADAPATAALSVERGVNALTSIEGSWLPRAAAELLTDEGATGDLAVQASFGPGFGVVDGSSAPARATLAVHVPGFGPPDLPSWMSVSDDLPWGVTLSVERGGDLDVGFAGGLDVTLDGADRPFAARIDVSTDGSNAAGRLVGELRSPWNAPFGADWLDVDTLTMTVELGDGGGAARFESAVVVVGRDADLRFDLAADGDSSSVRLLVGLERLSAADAVGLLATATGAAVPSDVPDMAIDDVLVDVQVGASTTVAIGGQASVAGQTADVLAGVESAGGVQGVVLGVALDSWRLGDAVPAVAGTVLEEIEFPPSALVLSSLEGSIDPAALSEPARRFFGGVDGGGPLQLTPGVSLFASLDLRGTSLERPLAALGFDDGRFPVVGTVPVSAIGLGGGGAGGGGGSVLSDLSLAVQLPEIAPSGAPDWFRGGRLSLVATGQPSLGLEGVMTVHIDGEDLTFVVGAEFARSTTGMELALFGAMETERPWESPFGIEWLTVDDLALQLTVDPIGTVGLGFAGSVVLGEHDVDVAIATEISAAGVPTNLAFQGASEEGLAFSDLVALQGEMAGAAGGSPSSLDGYPDLAVRSVEVQFAPQPFERLGIEAGFALVGDVWVESDGSAVRLAALDMHLDPNGLVAAGSLRGYDLGPIRWSDVTLDLALTPSDRHFAFDGQAELFGIRGGASVELSADSLFFRGQQAMEDLRRAVDLFEQLVRDPVGTLARVDEIFAAARVPAPPWVSELADAIEPLIESGAALSEQAIDTILNGGTIPLPVSPPNGEAPVCLSSTPIAGDDGRCYTTPPIPATAGVPDGGAAKECSRLRPYEQGGRCYTTLPKGKVCLASFEFAGTTYGMILRSDGRCYAKIPKVTGGYRYLPSGGVAPTIHRGTPSGGDPKICQAENPIDVGGRCYTVPPTPAVDGFPSAGEPKGCKALWTMENGVCWRISPSQASAGLGTPGLCKQFDVSCTVDDLVSGDIARALFDGVINRLDNW